MKIVTKKVGKSAVITEIEKLELEDMQTLVGGLIQPVYLDDIICWVNEEGKLFGLDVNVALAASYMGEIIDTLHGDIFFTNQEEGNEGLDSLQIQSLLERLNDGLFTTLTGGTYGADKLNQFKSFDAKGKEAAVVTTAPKAKTGLISTGKAQALVTAGKAEGGTMQYVIGKNAQTAPTSGWSKSIPKGTDAGTYYVWYKAAGDASHMDSAAGYVKVTIGKAKATVKTAPAARKLTYTGSAQKLVTEGKASGGTMLYALAKNGTYSKSVPARIKAGTYEVWYKVAGDKNHTDSALKSVTAKISEKKKPAITKVTVNVKTVNAKAVNKAVKKAGASKDKVTTIVLGKRVKKIKKGSLKSYKNAKTLVVKTKKLKRASVKKSLKGSAVTKIKVQVGSKKMNKKYVKKYKKIFTKKHAGRKVRVR